jgi:pilus assembly protein CpaE
MSNVLRLAIVDPDDRSRDALKASIVSMESVYLEAECSRYDFFADVVQQTTPDIVLVALDGDAEKALALVARLREESPDCSVLVASSSTDGNLILGAMRAGVKEFLPQPLKYDDLVAALDRVRQQRFGTGSNQSRTSSVIAVTGATGGVGATSLAVNLGCWLASDPQNSVVLVDLDLCLGDADVYLDTIPEYTLADVSQNIARLDFTLLKRSLTKHSSGLYLLPRPVQLEDIDSIQPEHLDRVIGLLKATFSHVIVDTSKCYNALDMAALHVADDVLLVTQLDLPCLRNIVRLMASFANTDGLKEKVKIVVNRAGRETGPISLKKAEETIDTEIFWQLPNDYRVMVEVQNNGVPLIEHAPKAAITQQIAELGAALCGSSDAGTAEDEASQAGRGWRNLWPVKAKD